MRVFVTGATGYVGQPLVAALTEQGHEVVALQRPGSQRTLTTPGIEVVEGDIRHVDALRRGMRACDAVVHLVGIIREVPRRGVTMERMHVEATDSVLRAARESGVGNVVHMSALGARANAVSRYHQTKWAAEQLVRQAGIPYTIFRPSVIFGRGGPGPEFVGQLAKLVQQAPVVPMIGDGRFPLQPVSLNTVAASFTQAVLEPRNEGFELGGPEILTYRQILQRIADALGKPLRTIPVPVRVMTTLVPWMQKLPGFPLTTDQLTMLLEGNTCVDSEAVYAAFQLPRIPFEVTVPLPG